MARGLAPSPSAAGRHHRPSNRGSGRPARSRQRGIGALGLLFWLFLAVAVLTIALRLGPSYLEFMTVKSVITSVKEDPSAAGAPRTQLLRMIQSRLDINNVASVKPADFAFERTADGSGTKVTVSYEVRRHVGLNIDAVLTFEHAETIPAQ